MEVNIQDVHYRDYINKIYYGSTLVFDRNTIYDANQNVYVFDLTKVSGNLTLTLQDSNGGTTTDWGDGVSDINLTHTYASQGTYIVKTRQRINDYSNDDSPEGELVGDTNTRNSLIKCINIDNSVTICAYMFEFCTNLTTASAIPNGVIICDGMFHGCNSLTTAPSIPNSVTTCVYMLNGCTSLVTLPQANIDLMQAVVDGTNTTCTNHSHCYYGCTKITTPQTYATLSGLYANWFTS